MPDNALMKKRQTLLCICLTVTQSIIILPPANCAEVAFQDPSSDFSAQYTTLTKKIILAGIQLERFSLNYRRESVKQPKYRRIRYFLSQEAAAGCELGFEITATEQFNKGRKRPLQISTGALRGSLNGALVGSIIGGAGSALELTSNGMLAVNNRRHGFSPGLANKFVINKLKEIDSLLADRDKLINSNSNNPAYARAVLEGEILKELRNAFLDEYSHFHADARGYASATNCYYAINVATSAVGATAAAVAFRGVLNPHLNGTANVLFIVAGALDIINPLLSSSVGDYMRRHALKSFSDQVGGNERFDYASLAAARAKLLATGTPEGGTLMPELPILDRLAIYEQSGDLFRTQIDSETRWMRHFEKVALQSSLLGPIVGGGLMAQGILGTTGYYRYPIRPRKQLSLFYDGAIVGTSAVAIATVGNAAWLLASYSYENHLRKQQLLPEQLIQDRLDHLNQLEKSISALN